MKTIHCLYSNIVYKQIADEKKEIEQAKNQQTKKSQPTSVSNSNIDIEDIEDLLEGEI